MGLLLVLPLWLFLCAITAGLFVAVVRGGRGGDDGEPQPTGAAVPAEVPAMRAPVESAVPAQPAGRRSSPGDLVGVALDARRVTS